MISFFCGQESEGERESAGKEYYGEVWGNLVHICALMSDKVQEFRRKGEKCFHDHTGFSLSHSF